MDPSSLDDCFPFWSNPKADFTSHELSVLLSCTTTLPGPSSELDFSRPPQSDSLASSYDNIGIFVEPVDPVYPHSDPIAANPPTTSAATHIFPYTPADILTNAGQPHTFGQDFDLTDSASASSPGTSPSNEPFTSRLAKRSMSFTRLSSQRGRLPFRQDSRPPNIDLPSGSTRRELSPLNIFSLQPSSTGPHTEPNLNETSFDWSSPHNPALLSPSPSSTLESRRKRSASSRSHRAASVSGQPGSTFLSVPVTRRRSTSVPSEPTSNFCADNLLSVTRPRAYSRSRPRSPAAGPSSLTTSPSGSSFDDCQDSIGSGGLPPIQLPPAQGIYNSYDMISSYQPSPEFPLLEIDSLNIYTHGNSSNSSIASQHSIHSQAAPSPQLHSADFNDLSGFDVNADYLHSIPPIADGLYHVNNGGGPSISITNTDDGSADPDNIFIQAGDDNPFMPDLYGFLNPSIFDDNPAVSGGQAASFTDDFSTIESAATSPADTLPCPAASPGDSERSFNHFDSPSPTTLDYGNLSVSPSTFSEHTFSEGQHSNQAHVFAHSQGGTRAANYTLTGGQHVSDAHSKMSATAVHEMHRTPNSTPTIHEPLKHNVRPQFHMPTGLGTYPHCDKNIPTAEGSSHSSSHSSHHLGSMVHHANVIGVGGTTSSPRRIGVNSLHENHFPRLHDGFSDLPAPSTNGSTAASSSSSMRRPSQASSDNNLDPQFEAKKCVYKILTESTSKDMAFARVIERAHETQSNLIRSVFDDALQRKVKNTPAGQQRAEDRRSRPPTFLCILCKSQFTTNNNRQNHYRSHLKMDQYRCPRCGDYFRTEGIRKRHTQSAQKCRRLGPEQDISDPNEGHDASSFRMAHHVDKPLAPGTF